MSGIPALLFLFAIGTAGYGIFKRLKWPMAALLGSICATGVLAVTGRYPDAPIDAMSLVCKVLIGIMMGRRMNRNSMRIMRHMIFPAALVSIWMILLSIAGGKLLSYLAGIPASTALIGSTTGGVSEMAIFAMSADYDVATVTVIQVTRLIMVLVSIPWIAQKWSAHLEQGKGSKKSEAQAGSFVEPKLYGLKKIKPMPRGRIAAMAISSLAGGVFFNYLGIPAGMMLGALAVSSAFVLSTDSVYPFPPKLLAFAQIGIGIAISRQFGPEQIAYLKNARFVISLLAVSALNISATLVLAFIVQKMTKWDPLTCLLATSAGGLSQMVVVAEEMKADSLVIGMLHLARYLSIVSVMPFLITLMIG